MGRTLLSAIVSASSAHERCCASQFRELDLSPGQPKVLSRLYVKEGHLQKDLAGLCRVEPATMAVLLSNMERKGLVRKETTHVSGGKRAYRIYLTDHGRAMAEKVVEIVEEVGQKCYVGFSEEEKEQLIALLGRVRDNLQ